MIVNFKKLHPNALTPFYAKEGDAGVDLTAVRFEYDKYGNKVYYTGIAVEIPKGYVGYIFPRSSVSKYTLILANCVGVIDSGYRGELIVKFKPSRSFGDYKNECPDDYTSAEYNVGDKIAQLIIMPLPLIEFNEVSELSLTDRGSGGFGHTGE